MSCSLQIGSPSYFKPPPSFSCFIAEESGASAEISSSLPLELSEFWVSEKLLQRWVVSRGVFYVVQGLINWSSTLDKLATWEDLVNLQQLFPHAPAWGQAGFYEWGSVIAKNQAGKVKAKEEVSGPVGCRTSTRLVKPNGNVCGLE
jgi:hypothetical protein